MKSFTATPNDDGVRLSRFCEKLCPAMPKSMLYKSFRNKRIKVNGKKQDADYTILTGDLNGTDTDDVHRYLMGECSLQGSDAYYFDLAVSYGTRHGSPPGPTLDFHRNPRWGVWEPENTLEIPMRCDRIYLSNPYPKPLPILQDCGIFGTEIFPETGLCASDHYGVYADLQF